jgi:hypothetical protein
MTVAIENSIRQPNKKLILGYVWIRMKEKEHQQIVNSLEWEKQYNVSLLEKHFYHGIVDFNFINIESFSTGLKGWSNPKNKYL